MSLPPRLTSFSRGPSPAEAARRSKRAPSGADPAPNAVEAPEAEPRAPASGDDGGSTAAVGSDGGASNRELAQSYSRQLLGDQDLQDCPGDADPSKKPLRRLARRRQTPAPGAGAGVTTSTGVPQRGGGSTISVVKPPRRRTALTSRPPADELSDEEMADVYRFGVDPVDLGWQPRGKNPRNTTARVELWEHLPTGVRVDFYYTTGKAKVTDRRCGRIEYMVVASRDQMTHMLRRWALQGAEELQNEEVEEEEEEDE